jgi:hypothetical protein
MINDNQSSPTGSGGYEIQPEPDTARVTDLLRGVRRGERDPDVELAELLPELDVGDDEAVILALEQLGRDEVHN